MSREFIPIYWYIAHTYMYEKQRMAVVAYTWNPNIRDAKAAELAQV